MNIVFAQDIKKQNEKTEDYSKIKHDIKQWTVKCYVK